VAPEGETCDDAGCDRHDDNGARKEMISKNDRGKDGQGIAHGG
jgi:hypothetical protein